MPVRSYKRLHPLWCLTVSISRKEEVENEAAHAAFSSWPVANWKKILSADATAAAAVTAVKADLAAADKRFC